MGETKNLQNEEALKKIKELVEDIKTCMFCTNVTGVPFNTRPMATADIDEEGNIWFISNAESHKNDEIKNDDKVQLIYAKGGNSHFLSIAGKATIVKDQGKIDEVWNIFINTWFKNGKKDPDVSLIKVIPDDVYYWDTVHGKMVSLLKIAVSAVSGASMDDGVEGKISI
jgi:general stress protein 26